MEIIIWDKKPKVTIKVTLTSHHKYDIAMLMLSRMLSHWLTNELIGHLFITKHPECFPNSPVPAHSMNNLILTD